MSELKQKDLRTPIGSAEARKLRGVIERATCEQAVAATATIAMAGGTPALHSGEVQSCFVVAATPAGAGESLTIDVRKNGVSILSAPLAYVTAHDHGAQVRLPFVAGTQINVGDMLDVVRTYVAGAGTLTGTVVGLEWS